jgi:uncharacterized phage protein (TIGR01671 family)
MREILFRGKTHDGEWVYGGYFEDRDYHFIPRGIGAAFVEVEQGTVGQFTGLLDNNGNKIFEGDIVDFYEVLGQQGITKEFKGVVKYGKGYYYVEYINERNRRGKWNLSSCWHLVVVGNIHDNKEERENE